MFNITTVKRETDETAEALKNSTLKDSEPPMSDSEDNLADLLTAEVAAVQASCLSFISGVKTHYKPLIIFMTVLGKPKFQGAITQIAVENAVVPMFLSPVNYRPFTDYAVAERPNLFITRTLHYLRFYHTDSVGKLEDISDDRCVDCDEI